MIKFSSPNLGYQTVRNENTRMENFLGQRGLIKPGLINKFIKFSDPNLGYQTVRNENTRMENFFGQAGLIKPRTDGKVSQASEKHAGENKNQKAFSPGRFHREHAGENENQKAFLLVLGYSSPKCSQMQSKLSQNAWKQVKKTIQAEGPEKTKIKKRFLRDVFIENTPEKTKIKKRFYQAVFTQTIFFFIGPFRLPQLTCFQS